MQVKGDHGERFFFTDHQGLENLILQKLLPLKQTLPSLGELLQAILLSWLLFTFFLFQS
jgi:hypothetical protein